MYFCINLYIDIIILYYYLFLGIKIEIDLYRNIDAFCLFFDDIIIIFVIEFDDIRLLLNRIMIFGLVYEFYLLVLKNNKILRFVIDRLLFKIYIVIKGRLELLEYNIIIGI